MIQLFLLSIHPSTYMAVFPILPDDALDRFGRNAPAPAADHNAKASVARDELDKELRYAAPHDVVAVMKWGLRHLRLRCADFDSKDADEWYDGFAAAERAAAYPARAIADLLHPKLPIATAELLSETLDLMASVAAHSSTNHMPAAQICKVLGFWLFGRIGVAHPPPTVDELVDAVNRAAGVAEHLLLAHIRSQASSRQHQVDRALQTIRTCARAQCLRRCPPCLRRAPCRRCASTCARTTWWCPSPSRARLRLRSQTHSTPRPPTRSRASTESCGQRS